MAEFQRRRDKNFPEKSIQNELTALTAPPFHRRRDKNSPADSMENELTELTDSLPVGDGQLPPLDRPPQTEMELRRLMDYLGDPVAFAQWFEQLMEHDE